MIVGAIIIQWYKHAEDSTYHTGGGGFLKDKRTTKIKGLGLPPLPPRLPRVPRVPRVPRCDVAVCKGEGESGSACHCAREPPTRHNRPPNFVSQVCLVISDRYIQFILLLHQHLQQQYIRLLYQHLQQQYIRLLYQHLQQQYTRLLHEHRQHLHINTLKKRQQPLCGQCWWHCSWQCWWHCLRQR
eukprot:GHVQ01027211.1.p1 GENE.GHVQ01027211.1~~GHVQ01027211.1.p1  ORF type:complete len:185 (+),score=27.07 GHVQ01027211.1:888-1442(+)